MIEKGTLGQRKEALMDYLEDLGYGARLQDIAERFGKDALMAAALEATELNKRMKVEKLAEIAFDLVPGQIRQVYNAHSATIVIPRLPDMNLHWNPDANMALPHFASLEQIVLEPHEWWARAMFAFDEGSGILAVREV